MNWIKQAHKAVPVNKWLNRLLMGIHRRAARRSLVCFFVPEKSKGWILEAACREIAQRLDVPHLFCGDYRALPKASAYFFCHYHFYLSAIRINPWLKHENCVVWFTHPKEPGLGGNQTIDALQHATVVTMSSTWKRYIIELGLQEDRVTTVVGAADPQFFPYHERGGGKVGFCTAYYERKHPDRILETVRQLPEYQFILMGRNWQDYPHFGELTRLNNLEYREAQYRDYPAFYAELDVFVSASQLEGGPIPLLESMMSNVVPVASNTGFAPDVIRHGENGFLFPADEPDSGRIAQLVTQAMQLRTDVRQTVLPYSWDAYAEEHMRLFKAA